jgi:hypothetical protein
MARNICVVPRGWDLSTYDKHNCQDGSHTHRTPQELEDDIAKGLVVWLRDWRSRGKKHFSVVTLLPTREELSAGAAARSGRTGRCASELTTTGLSARYGKYLAASVRRKKDWAVVMLRLIRRKTEASVDSQELDLQSVL